MAFYSDLASFRAAITRDLRTGSSIPDTQLDDMIRVVENRVNKDLRVKEMESPLAATISSSGTAALPSDYLDLKFSYVNTSPIRKLERKTAEWIYDNYPNRSAGTEKFIAREGSNFIFGEAGTQDRVVKGIYFAKPTAMTATINAVFSAYPELYLMAALAQSEPLIGRDPRIPVWEQRYMQYLENANRMYRDEDVSGSVLSATTA